MIGEKFIERKIEGNKVIRTSEWKIFDFDYEKIAIEINDNITDDPEELYNSYGIAMDMDDGFFFIECEKCLEQINIILKQDKEEDDEDDWHDWLKEFIKPLEEAKNYTIYLTYDDKDYLNGDSPKNKEVDSKP